METSTNIKQKCLKQIKELLSEEVSKKDVEVQTSEEKILNTNTSNNIEPKKVQFKEEIDLNLLLNELEEILGVKTTEKSKKSVEKQAEKLVEEAKVEPKKVTEESKQETKETLEETEEDEPINLVEHIENIIKVLEKEFKNEIEKEKNLKSTSNKDSNKQVNDDESDIEIISVIPELLETYIDLFDFMGIEERNYHFNKKWFPYIWEALYQQKGIPITNAVLSFIYDVKDYDNTDFNELRKSYFELLEKNKINFYPNTTMNICPDHPLIKTGLPYVQLFLTDFKRSLKHLDTEMPLYDLYSLEETLISYIKHLYEKKSKELSKFMKPTTSKKNKKML